LTVIRPIPVEATFGARLLVTSGASNENIPTSASIPVPTTLAIVRGNATLVPSPDATEQTMAVLLVQNDDRHRVLPIVIDGEGSEKLKLRPAIVSCAGDCGEKVGALRGASDVTNGLSKENWLSPVPTAVATITFAMSTPLSTRPLPAGEAHATLVVDVHDAVVHRVAPMVIDTVRSP